MKPIGNLYNNVSQESLEVGSVSGDPNKIALLIKSNNTDFQVNIPPDTTRITIGYVAHSSEAESSLFNVTLGNSSDSVLTKLLDEHSPYPIRVAAQREYFVPNTTTTLMIKAIRVSSTVPVEITSVIFAQTCP